MKKILTALFMMVVIVFGGFMLTGCGGGETGEAVYTKFETQFAQMKEEGTPFTSGIRNGITSNYLLDNFEKKVTNSVKTDYGDQDELIAFGLNFIEKYYPLANEYKETQDVWKINDTLNELASSFNTLKAEYQNTKKIASNEDMTIYNGFIARYAEAARQFSSRVYNCADALKEYLSNHVKVDTSVYEENPTAEAIEFYVESKLIDIYDDCNDLLMESGKASAGSMDAKWHILSLATIKDNISSDTMKHVVAYFNAIEGERQLTLKALENFSYYDYQVIYNGDIKAYEKTDSLAGIYYNQISKYYGNVLNYLYSFMVGNLY